jgi:hypothetical protein
MRKEPALRTKVNGLGRSTKQSPLAEGFYRARVVRFGPAGHAAKPCVAATFEVLQAIRVRRLPHPDASYRHERAVRPLRGFLSALKYDSEPFEPDELDDRNVVGVEGVIRLAY